MPRDIMFDTLYRDYRKLVFVVLRKYVRTGDLDDLSQQVWVRVWNNIDNFRQDAKPSSWLYRIAQKRGV